MPKRDLTEQLCRGCRIPAPPRAFRINRHLPDGTYTLEQVFPGITKTAGFKRLPKFGGRGIEASHCIEIKPTCPWACVIVSNEGGDRGCVAFRKNHLTRSTRTVLYLDLLHELYHVADQRRGTNLVDGRWRYVARPAERKAYLFSVKEARRMGANDAFLRDYLWTQGLVEAGQFEDLCKEMGVPVPKGWKPGDG